MEALRADKNFRMKEGMNKTEITTEEVTRTAVSSVHLNASHNYFSVLSSVLKWHRVLWPSNVSLSCTQQNNITYKWPRNHRYDTHKHTVKSFHFFPLCVRVLELCRISLCRVYVGVNGQYLHRWENENISLAFKTYVQEPNECTIY